MAIKGRLGTIGGTVLNAIAIYFMLSAATEAQTKIDLSNQSRSVDFSSAVSTKPIRMGTTLPAVCTQGEAFFKTNAVAGNNIYWCVAMNVWTLQAPKLAGDYTAAQITNAVDVTQTNSYSAGARQIFNPSAATAGLRISGSTLPSSPGAGDVALDATDANNLKVYNGAQWITLAGGGGGSSNPVVAGNGITVTGTPTQTIGVDTAVVPSYLSAVQTVDFGAVSGGSCAELTMSLNGAALGDSVAAGWPESLPAGTAGTMFVSLANVVTIRVCNVTSTAINPVNANFRATIIRSF